MIKLRSSGPRLPKQQRAVSYSTKTGRTAQPFDGNSQTIPALSPSVRRELPHRFAQRIFVLAISKRNGSIPFAAFQNGEQRAKRVVAQFGSALDWGSRGRRFKSCQPDQLTQAGLKII